MSGFVNNMIWVLIRKTIGTSLVIWIKTLIAVLVMGLFISVFIAQKTGESIWYTMWESTEASELFLTELFKNGTILDGFSKLPVVGIVFEVIKGTLQVDSITVVTAFEEIFSFLVFIVPMALFMKLWEALRRLRFYKSENVFWVIDFIWDCYLVAFMLLGLIAATNIFVDAAKEWMRGFTGTDPFLHCAGLAVLSIIVIIILLVIGWVLNVGREGGFQTAVLSVLFDVIQGLLILSVIQIITLEARLSLMSLSDMLLFIAMTLLVGACVLIFSWMRLKVFKI